MGDYGDRRKSWGGGGDRYNKQQRFSPEVTQPRHIPLGFRLNIPCRLILPLTVLQAEEEQGIARLLMQVGDSLSSVDSQLRDLAEALDPNLRTHGRFIAKLCIQG